MSPIRIGLVGDYNAAVPAHVAIPQALQLAATDVGNCRIDPIWLPTQDLTTELEANLSELRGLWCVPASPYISMAGALNAIGFARSRNVPFLGTCGGFQHAIIEYARNVLGEASADHLEVNPEAAMPIITPLACSLVEQEGRIVLKEGSSISRIYGRREISERYHCRYGLNPAYECLLQAGPLKFTGHDPSGAVRAVELGEHPFFIATLFQPERSAFRNEVHPLVRAFVLAAGKSYAQPTAVKNEIRPHPNPLPQAREELLRVGQTHAAR